MAASDLAESSRRGQRVAIDSPSSSGTAAAVAAVVAAAMDSGRLNPRMLAAMWSPRGRAVSAYVSTTITLKAQIPPPLPARADPRAARGDDAVHRHRAHAHDQHGGARPARRARLHRRRLPGRAARPRQRVVGARRRRRANSSGRACSRSPRSRRSTRASRARRRRRRCRPTPPTRSSWRRSPTVRRRATSRTTSTRKPTPRASTTRSCASRTAPTAVAATVARRRSPPARCWSRWRS